jgi:pyruvate,water dikinase
VITYDKPLAPQVNAMRKGDILVAGQTRPEIIAACRKAGAIVTNEGGICSHAAVVSREFSIPCIIGTKVATDMFKDGDRVEVDATKGIVKKI